MNAQKIKLLQLLFAILLLLSACKTFDTIKIKKTSHIGSKHTDTILEDGEEDLHEIISDEMFLDEIMPIEESHLKDEEILYLSFSGDLMAHINVTRMKDFSLIWEDIKPLIQKSDFAFINLESPVHNNRAYENYPAFNVQRPYVEAALDAGFNVFSLANNHTNDQGRDGILQTFEYFTELSERGIAWAGIKKETLPGYTFSVMQKNGFKLLFFAYTEILNQQSHKELIDYIPPNKKERDAFIEYAQKIKDAIQPDFCIVSVHCADPEYVIAVTNERKNFYKELSEKIADIVWGNHPHLVQEWEWIGNKETGNIEKAIFYACGNTISGQRLSLNYESPSAYREYTGDGIIFSLELKKDKNKKTYINSYSHNLITTIIDSEKNSLVKLFNFDFINLQNEKDKAYFTKRLELMKKIKGTTTWK